MQPLFGPMIAPVLPPAATPASRLGDGAPTTGAEPAAARLRPETRERVDPPRAPDRSATADLPGRRPLDPPPDPNSPAGPPPAFESSPLERQRQELRAPASLVPEIAAPPPEPPDAPEPPATPSSTERAAQAADPADGTDEDRAAPLPAAGDDAARRDPAPDRPAAAAPDPDRPAPPASPPGPEGPARDFAEGRRATAPGPAPAVDRRG